MRLKAFFASRFNLRKDIAWVLLIKLSLIFLLWALCFSHPVQRQLTVKKMQAQFLGHGQQNLTQIPEKNNATFQ